MIRTTTIVGAFTGMLAAIPVEAQTFWCDRPSKPYIPYYGAGRTEMQFAQSEVEQYVAYMRGYLECLQMEMDDASGEANRVIDEWNTVVRW